MNVGGLGAPARYVAVGVLVFSADLLTFTLLCRLGHLPIAAAQIVSRSTGAALGFVLHRAFTFRGLWVEQHHGARTQALGYAALTGVFLVVSAPWTLACIEVVGDVTAGKVVADLVLVVVAYLVSARLFRPADPEP